MPGDPAIDLHGLLVAEALRRVHAFLLAEQARGTIAVRITTGHGTGALKRAVRDQLDAHPSVASWSSALAGDATTVAVLRAPGRSCVSRRSG